MERGEGGEDIVFTPVGERGEDGERGRDIGRGTELAEGLGGNDADVGRGVDEGGGEFGVRASHDGGATHIEAERAPVADGAVGVGKEFFQRGSGVRLEGGGEFGGGEDAFEGILRIVVTEVVGGLRAGAGEALALGDEAEVADAARVGLLRGAKFGEGSLVRG